MSRPVFTRGQLLMDLAKMDFGIKDRRRGIVETEGEPKAIWSREWYTCRLKLMPSTELYESRHELVPKSIEHYES